MLISKVKYNSLNEYIDVHVDDNADHNEHRDHYNDDDNDEDEDALWIMYKRLISRVFFWFFENLKWRVILQI